MKYTLIIALILGSSLTSNAQNGLSDIHQIEIDMQRCIDDSSQLESRIMLECIFRAHRRYERVVDTSYSELISNYPEGMRETLEANQTAWEAYIQTQIQMNREHYESYSARMYRVIEARERMKLWKERALFMATLYRARTENRRTH
ncbi:MAG: DUF1311 domain-containing protein [Flavobacteriia bacterium]|nr:DUF1311 domain-containing protein [Flavobacteriia bacterium]